MSTAPHIFDEALRASRRERAARRGAKNHAKSNDPAFFTERCASDTVERLLDISRSFQNALIIAPPDFWPLVKATLPSEKHPAQVTQCQSILHTAILDEHGIVKSYDLVISVLDFHSLNDLPAALGVVRSQLKPDGLMLACLFGGATLTELRQSFYRVETRFSGGLSPRVIPMIDFSQAAGLLQQADFALPVIDIDRFTLSYKTLFKLASDLRDAGQSNILVKRAQAALSKSFADALQVDLFESAQIESAQIKSEAAANRRFAITFEIIWMTGWAPDASQQKPLKPGSAKMRLADALGVKELKL